MSEANSPKKTNPMKLKSLAALRDFQRKWWRETHERVKQGEPFGICYADEAEDIFNAFDMPCIVIPWWTAIISAKGMSEYYGNVLAEHGYDMELYTTLGLGVTLDNDPEKAPWGGLPKPAIIIGTTTYDFTIKSTEIWAREYGCPYFPMEISYNLPTNPYPHRWWERIRDHWDEVIEPYKIDLKVEELKELIRFLELNTGRQFSLYKLTEMLELVNEQETYWGKARDLIAATKPCPVTLVDQLNMYPAQWHRGKPEARDLIKMFYEEVKERVENGVSAYPDEKIRLMWLGVGLWVNQEFHKYFEEEFDATFVCSIYTSIAADGYARRIINGDPLRAIASRFAWLGVLETEWMVKIAKFHQCDGMVMFKCGPQPSIHSQYFEKAGIPACEIPGHNVDARQWKDAESRAIVKNFMETRILPKRKDA